jgi:hypothetical protein
MRRLGLAAFGWFALAWLDGERFLIDAGMDRESAEGFGAAFGSGFSHLHTDPADGLDALCSSIRTRVPFQTRAQHEEGNYTTRRSRAQIGRAAWVETGRLEPAPLAADPG